MPTDRNARTPEARGKNAKANSRPKDPKGAQREIAGDAPAQASPPRASPPGASPPGLKPAPELAGVIEATVKLWRKHHLSYDQTKYVVEQARRRLQVSPPRERRRTVERLDYAEVERLIAAAYRHSARYGLMVKTLFYTGARVGEFVQIAVADLHLDGDPPQIHLAHAKGRSTRYVPLPGALADELRTHLGARKAGYLFESNRHDRYSARAVQDIVKEAASAAGIARRVYPHLLRHSVATLLLQSGEVPLDQVQKLLGHRQIGTTQIYAQTSLRSLGENYRRAVEALPRRRAALGVPGQKGEGSQESG